MTDSINAPTELVRLSKDLSSVQLAALVRVLVHELQDRIRDSEKLIDDFKTAARRIVKSETE